MSLVLELHHSFDAAHRLPHLGGKCRSVHGHTWNVSLGLAGPLQADMTVVEFSLVKRLFRAEVDEHYDHGFLVGVDDPLLPVVAADGGKHLVFGVDAREHLPWPSVEAVATALGEWAVEHLTPHLPGACRITFVRLAETPVNTALWTRGA